MSLGLLEAPRKPLKILVVGEICNDVEYLVRPQARLNPEDSKVPIYSSLTEASSYGMAHNVLSALNKLLAKDNPQIGACFSPAGTKSRWYSFAGEYIMRIDEDYPSVSPVELPPTLNYDAIVVSDYCKGAVTPDTLNILVGTGLPVFIDSKRKDLARFSSPNVIFKINSHEYENLDHSIPFNECTLVVTYGARGSECMSIDSSGQIESVIHTQGCAIDAKSVCGAGDMFLAGLVYGVVTTSNLRGALFGANMYAALSVSKPGIYIPTLREYQEFLSREMSYK